MSEHKEAVTANAASDSERSPRPRIRIAQAKMGTLFASVAALIVCVLLLIRNASLAETAKSAATVFLVFWWLGWCVAFVTNTLLRRAYRRLEEDTKAEEEEETEAPAVENGETSPA